MPTSSSSGVLALFSPRNKLLCWFEAYSYVFTAQTTGLWKTACDSLAQTRETAQIYGSRILIAPPTSAIKLILLLRGGGGGENPSYNYFAKKSGDAGN